MTRRFLCTATCLALCWCLGSDALASPPDGANANLTTRKSDRYQPVTAQYDKVPDWVVMPGPAQGTPRGPGTYATSFGTGTL